MGTKLINLRVSILLAIFLFGCKEKLPEPSADKDGPDIFTDPRDGQKYRTVKIDSLVWFAENLNYKPLDSLNSWCYDNEASNCEKYGRLYDFHAAVNACPEGWHLPSHKEWRKLAKIAGGVKVAGIKLKSDSLWVKNGGGTDSLGFAALPGGGGYKRIFSGIGERGIWWTADEGRYSRSMLDATNFGIRAIDGLAEMEAYGFKETGFSVRCVRRDYVPEIVLAAQLREKAEEAQSFSDYEKYFDSLVTDSYKTVFAWCRIMEQYKSELSKHYLEGHNQKEYFLRYHYERCHKPVKEFEFSVTGIGFYEINHKLTRNPARVGFSGLSIGKKANVTYAFERNFNRLAELSLEEWQTFLRDLYFCCVSQWEKEYKDHSQSSRSTGSHHPYWEFNIYSPDKPLKFFGDGNRAYPNNFDEFLRIIRKMERKAFVNDEDFEKLKAKMEEEPE